MKKALLIGLIGLISLIGPIKISAAEQKADSIEGWKFTTVDSVAITPVKDQNRSGTCWCFSTIAFLESEIIRKNACRHREVTTVQDWMRCWFGSKDWYRAWVEQSFRDWEWTEWM